MKEECYVILSYKDELMVVHEWDRWEISKKRYEDLKHQFNKFKTYKKIDK